MKIVILPTVALLVVILLAFRGLKGQDAESGSGGLSNRHSNSISSRSPEANTGVTQNAHVHDGNAAPAIWQPSNQETIGRRIDLEKCRKLVLAGDVPGLIELNGDLDKGDALTFYSLLREVPASLPKEDRAEIRKRLMKFLWFTPGEEAERLMLLALEDQELADDLDTRFVWAESLMVLAHRRSAQAVPFLEQQALQADPARSLAATSALLMLEPKKYIPLVVWDLSTAGESKAGILVGAIRGALQYWNSQKVNVDFRSAIDILQTRFGSAPRDNTRMAIVEILESYASRSNSEDVKMWLIQRLGSMIGSSDGHATQAEVTYYRDVLHRLQAK